MSKKGNLTEVAKVFFKLGLIAFGGPAAHIAMIEAEIVSKRKWMDRQHFLDLIGATNLIPGPNSTEMTMHCGYQRSGILGLFVAGFTFIFPAVVLTVILAYFYVEYGNLPQVEPFIFGIKPAVLAIIASAIFKLGKKALKSWELGILGALVILIVSIPMLGVNEILALLVAGVLGAFYFYSKTNFKNSGTKTTKSFLPIVLLNVSVSSITKIATLKIFWTFLKVGSVLYGSGYVLFAYLDIELVETGMMLREELMDAIAVGQFTPGPVLSTATFIGYQLGGFWGALGATLGIFLPSFFFVLILNPLIPKMRKSKFLGYFLDSVNIATVAIMVSVLFTMGRDILFDSSTPFDWETASINWRATIIAAINFGIVFGIKKVNAMWVVLGGSILGYLFSLV